VAGCAAACSYGPTYWSDTFNVVYARLCSMLPRASSARGNGGNGGYGGHGGYGGAAAGARAPEEAEADAARSSGGDADTHSALQSARGLSRLPSGAASGAAPPRPAAAAAAAAATAATAAHSGEGSAGAAPGAAPAPRPAQRQLLHNGAALCGVSFVPFGSAPPAAAPPPPGAAALDLLQSTKGDDAAGALAPLLASAAWDRAPLLVVPSPDAAPADAARLRKFIDLLSRKGKAAYVPDCDARGAGAGAGRRLYLAPSGRIASALLAVAGLPAPAGAPQDGAWLLGLRMAPEPAAQQAQKQKQKQAVPPAPPASAPAAVPPALPPGFEDDDEPPAEPPGFDDADAPSPMDAAPSAPVEASPTAPAPPGPLPPPAPAPSQAQLRAEAAQREYEASLLALLRAQQRWCHVDSELLPAAPPPRVLAARQPELLPAQLLRAALVARPDLFALDAAAQHACAAQPSVTPRAGMEPCDPRDPAAAVAAARAAAAAEASAATAAAAAAAAAAMHPPWAPPYAPPVQQPRAPRTMAEEEAAYVAQLLAWLRAQGRWCHVQCELYVAVPPPPALCVAHAKHRGPLTLLRALLAARPRAFAMDAAHEHVCAAATGQPLRALGPAVPAPALPALPLGPPPLPPEPPPPLPGPPLSAADLSASHLECPSCGNSNGAERSTCIHCLWRRAAPAGRAPATDAATVAAAAKLANAIAGSLAAAPARTARVGSLTATSRGHVIELLSSAYCTLPGFVAAHPARFELLPPERGAHAADALVRLRDGAAGGEPLASPPQPQGPPLAGARTGEPEWECPSCGNSNGAERSTCIHCPWRRAAPAGRAPATDAATVAAAAKLANAIAGSLAAAPARTARVGSLTATSRGHVIELLSSAYCTLPGFVAAHPARFELLPPERGAHAADALVRLRDGAAGGEPLASPPQPQGPPLAGALAGEPEWECPSCGGRTAPHRRACVHCPWHRSAPDGGAPGQNARGPAALAAAAKLADALARILAAAPARTARLGALNAASREHVTQSLTIGYGMLREFVAAHPARFELLPRGERDTHATDQRVRLRDGAGGGGGGGGRGSSRRRSRSRSRGRSRSRERPPARRSRSRSRGRSRDGRGSLLPSPPPRMHPDEWICASCGRSNHVRRSICGACPWLRRAPDPRPPAARAREPDAATLADALTAALEPWPIRTMPLPALGAAVASRVGPALANAYGTNPAFLTAHRARFVLVPGVPTRVRLADADEGRRGRSRSRSRSPTRCRERGGR
jgi:hypothetical protein